jgi:hypothetical protein
MAGFDALSVRDLVALVVIGTATMRGSDIRSPEVLVADAFAIADQFVGKSEGKWADGARANHQSRAKK